MKESTIFLVSAIFRIFLDCIVLFVLPLPLFWKAIFLILIDSLELCSPNCNYHLPNYHIYDKITDSIGYILLFYYIAKNKLLPKNDINLIFPLLIFRLVGTLIFICLKNREILLFFPNFFLEMTIMLSLVDAFPSLKKYKFPLKIIVFVIKIVHEYIMHHNK